MWETLVFDAVTGEFPDTDKVCGVRLLDKSSNDRPSVFRIEVWTTFDSADSDESRNLIKYINQKFSDTLAGSDFKGPVKFAGHK